MYGGKLDRRPGVTLQEILRNWGLVFVGNFAGSLTVAFIMAFVFTYGFSTGPGPVGTKIASIGVARTLGYAQYGLAGWLTVFLRGIVQLGGLHSMPGSGPRPGQAVTSGIRAMSAPSVPWFSRAARPIYFMRAMPVSTTWGPTD